MNYVDLRVIFFNFYCGTRTNLLRFASVCAILRLSSICPRLMQDCVVCILCLTAGFSTGWLIFIYTFCLLSLVLTLFHSLLLGFCAIAWSNWPFGRCYLGVILYHIVDWVLFFLYLIHFLAFMPWLRFEFCGFLYPSPWFILFWSVLLVGLVV